MVIVLVNVLLFVILVFLCKQLNKISDIAGFC